MHLCQTLLLTPLFSGFADDYVLGALKQVVTIKQYSHLVGSSKQGSSHLPTDYIRMVPKHLLIFLFYNSQLAVFGACDEGNIFLSFFSII